MQNHCVVSVVAFDTVPLPLCPAAYLNAESVCGVSVAFDTVSLPLCPAAYLNAESVCGVSVAFDTVSRPLCPAAYLKAESFCGDIDSGVAQRLSTAVYLNVSLIVAPSLSTCLSECKIVMWGYSVA